MQEVRLRKTGWSSTIPAADACGPLRSVLCRSVSLLVCAWLLCAPVSAVALSRGIDLDPVTLPGMIEHVVRPGDCFAAILAANRVPTDEITRWHQAARPQFDLGHLDPGRTLRLLFDALGRLRALRYTVDADRTLVVERGTGDRLVPRMVELPVTVRTVGVRATVRSSFFAAARQAGLPDAIISQMVDLLSWEVSFKSDVHRGDRFRVLYEQRIGVDGRPRKPGRILAVDYRGRTESVAAYLYGSENGEPLYADDNGHLLNGAPLRYPLEFTRISSAFSQSRFHPILQLNRPHLGVDFAAPAGTPVRSIGPGTVQWAGVKGGFGNHVEIDHGKEFVSTYSHLQGIANGLTPGARVARGQLLGWVGQTGLATGAHLHFAIFAHGEYVDPLTIKHPPQLAAVESQPFAQLRTAMWSRLEALSQTPSAPSAPETGPTSLAQANGVGPITLTF